MAAAPNTAGELERLGIPIMKMTVQSSGVVPGMWIGGEAMSQPWVILLTLMSVVLSVEVYNLWSYMVLHLVAVCNGLGECKRTVHPVAALHPKWHSGFQSFYSLCYQAIPFIWTHCYKVIDDCSCVVWQRIAFDLAMGIWQ